jgi:regulator of sigma E protease
MLVISAGVMMNILLAICIFWGINYTHGRLLEQTTEIGYVFGGSPAEKAGLLTGDNILQINGKPVSYWDDILNTVYLENFGKDLLFVVDRKGEHKTITLTRDLFPDNPQKPLGIVEAHSVIMAMDIEPGMPADKMGLKAGDVFLTVNTMPIVNDSDVIKIVQANVGKKITITWKRNDEVMSGTAVPTEQGRIGIRLGNYYTGPKIFLRYSAFEALGAGVSNVVQSTNMFFKSIGQVITGKASLRDNFGGPIAIAKLATQSAESGLTTYLGFMALLSMSLAILNILPFPALDGGHLMMLVYEKIFRREIPQNVKLGIQKVGVILLLAFMAFVIYNDISRF